MPSRPRLTLDAVVGVVERTLLNPVVALPLPLLLLLFGRPPSSPALLLSSAYCLLVTLVALIRLSSTAWTNKPGRSWLEACRCPRSLDWSRQIVVVTGGAGGVGRVLVRKLQQKGAVVVALDVVERPAEMVDRTHYYKCDLTKREEIEAVVRRMQVEVGHPTILVNNAGIVQGKLLLDLDRAELEQTFDVNVLAQFTLLKLLLPEIIRKRAGHIVTVASVFGLAGSSQLSEYSASKHALLGLHDSLRNELIYRHGNPPVRTTLVIPGQIRTALFASLAPPSRFVGFLAPVVTPEEVAEKIVEELERERSGVVHLPVYAAWLWIVRAAPSWFGDGLVWISGANEAMERFVKAGEEPRPKDA